MTKPMTPADPRDGLQGLVAKWRKDSDTALLASKTYRRDGGLTSDDELYGQSIALTCCADDLEAALAHARPEAVDERVRDLWRLAEEARVAYQGHHSSGTFRCLRDGLATLTPDQSP